MQKVLRILSQAISIVFYPLLIPTYGMGLFFLSFSTTRAVLPASYPILCIVGTLLFTAVIPILLILLMWRMGQISSLYITDAKQRDIPYLCCTLCFVFWCQTIHNMMHLPTIWLVIALGSTVALACVWLINHWWKISAHLTALGGLLGGVCSFGLYYAIPITPWVIIVLAVSLLLMYARLYLEAHTPLQVTAGIILGLICTFIPNLILYHA